MAALALTDDLKRQIVAILQRHGVAHAGVFGSFARGAATETSDVDVLIEFAGQKSLLDLSAVALELEALLGRRVDVVTYRSLNPRIKEGVLRDQVVIL